MKEIHVRNPGRFDLTEIASLSQQTHQCSNACISLMRCDTAQAEFPAGTLVVMDDDGSQTRDYQLDAEEAAEALAAPDAYLKEWARCTATEGPWNRRLELCRWRLDDPEDFVVTDAHQGACQVIVKGSYYWYTPLEYVKDERTGEPREFTSYAEAQAYVTEQEQGTYYLGHNEAGRPVYTIVAAE